MKLFKCGSCGQVLYFENTRCERCRHKLGYEPESATLLALDPAGDVWIPAVAATGSQLRFCANAAYDACNWLIPPTSDQVYCLACRHNRTVPNLNVALNVVRWRKLELAKHRLFYTLLRLNLPLKTRTQDPTHGLVFDFLAEPIQPGTRVMTGHDDGLITIALQEADDAEREKLRTQMGEPYRTLLGHFRHEVGHHFWDLLVRDGGLLNECREIFGDDSQNYEQALQRHYANGAPADWQEQFISAYATAHPWEDFAETWAHYLHMLDTLEMARAFGISVHPRIDADNAISAYVDFDPHNANIHKLVDAWLPLSFAINSLNRSMGQPDFYPFVLSPAVVNKLGFIAGVIARRANS